MIIGVLALQGDFREHIRAVDACGHEALEVRRVSELDQCQALILPGGESTTIALFAPNDPDAVGAGKVNTASRLEEFLIVPLFKASGLVVM